MNNKTLNTVSALDSLSADELRQLGYRVIDMIVDHRQGLRSKPVHQQRSRKELDAALPQAMPRSGTDPGPAQMVVSAV